MDNEEDPLRELRENFARIAERLTPDVEPAVVYSLEASNPPEAPNPEAE